MSSDDLTFQVERGPSKGKSIQVKRHALVIGSDASADVIVEGPGVEPRHAQIVFQGGQVMLEDLSKESGTFRNGKRLLGPIQVFPGDRIGLGPEVVLILEGDDPHAPEAENETSPDEGLEDLPGAADQAGS